MKPITLTISSGRSGTYLLKTLFAQVTDMFADHECEPSFSSVRKANLADKSIGLEFVRKHLEYVDQLPGKYYSNTDHAAGKGMLEHFIELGANPTFVILRRNPREVASSLFQLNWIPGMPVAFYQDINAWIPSPSEPGNLALPGWGEGRIHSYKICYWYVLNCELAAWKYSMSLPRAGFKVWETTNNQATKIEHFNAMLEHFDLPRVDKLVSERVNGLEPWKDVEPPPAAFCERLENELLESIPGDFRDHLERTNWRNIE